MVKQALVIAEKRELYHDLTVISKWLVRNQGLSESLLNGIQDSDWCCLSTVQWKVDVLESSIWNQCSGFPLNDNCVSEIIQIGIMLGGKNSISLTLAQIRLNILLSLTQNNMSAAIADSQNAIRFIALTNFEFSHWSLCLTNITVGLAYLINHDFHHARLYLSDALRFASNANMICTIKKLLLQTCIFGQLTLPDTMKHAQKLPCERLLQIQLLLLHQDHTQALIQIMQLPRSLEENLTPIYHKTLLLHAVLINDMDSLEKRLNSFSKYLKRKHINACSYNSFFRALLKNNKTLMKQAAMRISLNSPTSADTIHVQRVDLTPVLLHSFTEKGILKF